MITDRTIVFDEDVKGWTSFFSYDPEYMTGLNGKFFTFKGGELWCHNSKKTPRNNFYGQQFTSKVAVVLNERPSVEKMYKNIMLEGNKTWNIKLTSNLTEGEIFRNEFHKRKSRYFAYTRRNEDATDLTSFAANGIGVAQSVVGDVVSFNSLGDLVNVGDTMVQVQSGNEVVIGTIDSINFTDKALSFGAFDNTPLVGEFCFAKKDPRTESGELRGYYMRADLENDDVDFTELFAITSNTVDSYV